MTSLYNLSSNYQNIARLLDDETMQPEIINTALAEIKGSMIDKCANIAGLMKDLQSDIEAVKVEEKRLADRRRFTENKVRWLKGYIQEAMEQTGQDKIKTPLWTFSLQKNPPSVIIDDMGALPRRYIIETISQAPDKALLKKEIKEGQEIPGAHLEQGVSLRIK